jgi:Ca2+-binding EF-hand superfamily protein
MVASNAQKKPVPADLFGQGDRVKLTAAAKSLEYGCMRNWLLEEGAVAEVLIVSFECGEIIRPCLSGPWGAPVSICLSGPWGAPVCIWALGGTRLLTHRPPCVQGGRRWKGDCLVCVAGQRLWVKQSELQMVQRSDEPRPSTQQEKALVRRRLARERQKRHQAQVLGSIRQGGNTNIMDMEEIEFFFDQLDEDGNGELDEVEVAKLFGFLGVDLASQPRGMEQVMAQLDRNDDGQVGLGELISWWRRSGEATQEKFTALNDRMHSTRELFDQIDVDGSGLLDRTEVERLVKMLGVHMNGTEIDAAMQQMDSDASGEVDFQEFWSWWTDIKTSEIVEHSRNRVQKVKALFDNLDEDSSGTLQRAELLQLATSLGAELTSKDFDSVLSAIAPLDRNAVQFLEFYQWWNSSSSDALAEARRHRQVQREQWRNRLPATSSYSSIEPEVARKPASGGMAGDARQPMDKLIKYSSSSAYAAPRTRRCTVEQLATFVGGGPMAQEAVLEEQQLLAVAELGDVDQLAQLLDGGVDANCQLLGVSALTVAAANGHAEVVTLLLEQRNDDGDDLVQLDVADPDGLTPLDWAIAGGHQEIIDILRNLGVGESVEQQPDHARLERVNRVEKDVLLRAADGELKVAITQAHVANAMAADKLPTYQYIELGKGTVEVELTPAIERAICCVQATIRMLPHRRHLASVCAAAQLIQAMTRRFLVHRKTQTLFLQVIDGVENGGRTSKMAHAPVNELERLQARRAASDKNHRWKHVNARTDSGRGSQ